MSNSALAAATITPASGGANISIDTTSAPGGSGVYVTLSGPTITENAPGDIVVGFHTIKLPVGWEFDINSTVTVMRAAGDIEPVSQVITPGTDSFIFNISKASTEKSTLVFLMNSMRVRPNLTTPDSGKMTYSGVGIDGVDSNTSFGTLSTVPGVVKKLAFSTEPGGATYGELLSSQPVVKTQDQFGNDSINGLASDLQVSLALSAGDGGLVGAAALGIGSGTASFTDVTVNRFGTGKQLTASAVGLTSAVSNSFEINKKTLTATITADSKTYDGGNIATFSSPVVTNPAFSDSLTLTGGTATFDTAAAGTNKTVTATGLVLDGINKDNYTFDETAIGTANIDPLVVTVTPTAGQSKIYGNPDPVFTHGYTPLVGTDSISGFLGRASGDDIGNYAYTLGTMLAGGNYSLSLDTSSSTFEIKKRDFNVTAAGVSRPYDGTANATVIFSSDKLQNDDVTIAGTAVFTGGKDIGVNKTISVSGINISGTKAVNYNLKNETFMTTANITAVPLTVSFTINDKVYDGDSTAVITGRTATGMVSGETVDVNGGTANFAGRNVGNHTVSATGFTLGGNDAGNYVVGSVTPTTANITARPITVTADSDSRMYNGTPNSEKTPVLSSALVGGDTVNFSQAYDNKNVGTGKTITPSGNVNDNNSGLNYAVTFVPVNTGEITKKSIDVTAQPDTRVYDGTTVSSVAPKVGPLETGDSVTTAPVQVYGTKDVGTGKTLTPSGLVINDGNNGDNYVINYVNSTAGVINAKNLTVSGAITNSKVYDDSATATVNFTGARLSGVINPDDVSLNPTGYAATFDNKNVGANKTVAVSGLTLAGAGEGNYSLTQPTLADGVITVKSLTVTATGVNKTYNATDVATVNLLSDKLGDDIVIPAYTAATFDNKNVADGKTINISGITISGADAGNYTLANTAATTTANINQATLEATVTVADKVIDGNNSATITSRTLHGLISGDKVTVNEDGTATFVDSAVGNGKVVTASGISISGDDAANYNFNGTATGVGNIIPIPTAVYIDDDFTSESVLGGDLRFGYDAFASIQEGIDAVDVNGVVNVAAGTYTGDIDITKSLTLQGVSGANIVGQVVISNDGVTIDGLGISNPAGNFGIVATDVNNITLTDNAISNIGTSLASGSAQAIGIISVANDVSGITIGGNTISNIGNLSMLHGGGAGSSAKGIYLGNSGGEKNISGVSISNNAINSVYASGNAWVSGGGGGAGAYGILINHSTGSIGKTISPNVSNNTISDLNGLWSHGIGLEGNTPGAIVTGNTVSGLASSKTPSDAVAVMVEANASADSVNISQNKLDANFGVMNAVSGETVKAEENWWGTADNAAIAAKFSGLVDYRPWYTSDTLTNPDSTPPTATVSSATTSPTNATSIPVTITFSEPVYGFTAEDITAVNGTKGTFSGSGASYMIDITPTENSVVKVSVAADIAEDLSGNYSLISNELSIVHDKIAPTTSLTGAPEGTVNTKTATITVGGTDVTHYKYKLDTDADYGAEYLITTKISLSELRDKDHIVSVIGRDAAGNYQLETEAATATWTIDATPPALPVIASIGGVDNKISNAEKAAIIVIGTAEAGSTVRVSLAGGSVTVTETGTTDESGNYSIVIDGSTLPDGGVSPSVTATDATGNESLEALTPTAIKDVVAPSVTDKTPSVNAVGIAPSANMTIAFSENVVITGANVTITGNPAKSVTFDSNANVATIDPTDNLANNTTYTVALTGVTDLTGNALPTMSWSFTTAASYSIPLTLGWNLISLPVVPTNTVASAVLGSLNDLSKIQSVFTYDAVNGQWLVYHPGSPETSSFSTMTAGTGYWINYLSSATASLAGTGNLFLEGNNTPPQKELSPGWNLIGYFQLENTISATAANALSTVAGQWTQLRTYNNAAKQFQAIGASDMMQPGQGFWIFMKSSSYAPYLYGPGDSN